MGINLKGNVVAVSPGGDLITSISESDLANSPRDESVSVGCGGHETCGIYASDHDQPAGTFIAILGESGNLELAIVGESISLMLGLGVGEAVTVSW